jgi:hypothetical protein
MRGNVTNWFMHANFAWHLAAFMAASHIRCFLADSTTKGRDQETEKHTTYKVCHVCLPQHHPTYKGHMHHDINVWKPDAVGA